MNTPIDAKRALNFLAIFLPAADTVFNLGVWGITTVMNSFYEWPDHIVLYEEQGLFFGFYLFCVICGFGCWVASAFIGRKPSFGPVGTGILTATLTLIWQFITTFAVYQ